MSLDLSDKTIHACFTALWERTGEYRRKAESSGSSESAEQWRNESMEAERAYNELRAAAAQSEQIDFVTVCNRCLQASCWQGEFMCEEARAAGTVDLPVKTLKELDREHPDYWKRLGGPDAA